MADSTVDGRCSTASFVSRGLTLHLTCNVDVVLLVMCCMCIMAFIVTSADISQLWVYLCYLLMYSLRLFVVVYKLVGVMLLLMDCMCIPTFIVVTVLVV